MHPIAQAVVAALDNVARHAGDGARAWVLLDADETGVEVVVRDNGVGMPVDRLVRAADEGAQFIIATHSPILLACPGARIFSFDASPIREQTR